MVTKEETSSESCSVCGESLQEGEVRTCTRCGAHCCKECINFEGLCKNCGDTEHDENVEQAEETEQRIEKKEAGIT